MNLRRRSALSFSLVLLLNGGLSESSDLLFRNQFLEFQLPSSWKCALQLQEVAWTCKHANPEKEQEEILVFAAKLKSEQETLKNFQEYLNAPKTYRSVIGEKKTLSKVTFTRTTNIQDHSWVDALHLHSEIPGYYTRYFATIKNDITVLVTYSVKKELYKQRIGIREKLLQSLKVVRRPPMELADENPVPAEETGKPVVLNAQPVARENSLFPSRPQFDENSRTPATTGQEKEDDLSFYLMIVAAACAIILIRRRLKDSESNHPE